MKVASRASIRFLVTTGLLALGLLSPKPADAQVVYFGFDNNTGGTTSTSTGSSMVIETNRTNTGTTTALWGASASGVTGQPGDVALNLTASTMAGTGSGASIATTDTASFNSAASFSLVGWRDATAALVTGARLYDMSTSGAGFLLSLTDTGNLNLQVNGGTVNVLSSTVGVTQTNVWTFFGVTYDSINKTIVIYQGVKGGSLLSQTFTLTGSSATAATAVVNPATALIMGANGGYGRGYQGYLDDMGIYAASDASGALNSTQMNALFNAVPEPSTYALMAGGLGALLLVGRRRRLGNP